MKKQRVLKWIRHTVKKTFKERKENGEFTGRYGKHNNGINNKQYTWELFELTAGAS